jgi:hypothetical protein
MKSAITDMGSRWDGSRTPTSFCLRSGQRASNPCALNLPKDPRSRALLNPKKPNKGR